MSGTLRTQLMALHPYGVTRRVPIGDTGLVLIVGNNGTAFRLESASGSVTFDADASELVAMTLRREHLTSERQWRDPPNLATHWR